MIQVDPGFSESTVLTFKGLGNQAPKCENSNLVVKFSQKENKQFKRSGDNLILTQTVSLEDVLKAKPVQIKTLDGRSLTLGFDELVSP
jgi:DnaJ-class molecular chaperone